jgi:hypothetical protein
MIFKKIGNMENVEAICHYLEFIRMEDELSEKLDIKVDLVLKTALKTHIGRRILAEMIPV